MGLDPVIFRVQDEAKGLLKPPCTAWPLTLKPNPPMESLPLWIGLLFGIVVAISIAGFYWASGSKPFLWGALGWTALQCALGMSGIFQNTDAMPPRIMLFGILPSILAIVFILSSRSGQSLTDGLNLKRITLLHTVRVPVEIVLTLLFHYGVLSVYTTWEGTNFDVLSGLSAPIIAYLAFKNGGLRKGLLIGWNIACLLLLLNVVVTAIFAFPSPFQKLAFDQPNLAILYFPFNLLPSVVVPIVMLSHLAVLKRLMRTGA